MELNLIKGNQRIFVAHNAATLARQQHILDRVRKSPKSTASAVPKQLTPWKPGQDFGVAHTEFSESIKSGMPSLGKVGMVGTVGTVGGKLTGQVRPAQFHAVDEK